MIPLSIASVESETWQRQLATAISDPAELLELLELPESLLAETKKADKLFPLKVTHDFLNCMQKGNPHDPLLRQVLPLGEETRSHPGYTHNPVGDAEATVCPGLIHKYQGRALLITTPACAIHCRYCFRRHYPYQESSAHGRQLELALDYIREHEDISEVILSGGDPLALSDKQLGRILGELASISHVRRIRLHSRLPIVLPDRITESLLKLLSETELQIVLVVHCNHANELSDKVGSALENLFQSGTTLLNQSVLLAGVNDDSDSLVELSEKLFANRVLPYYLHCLDPVEGAHHFDIPQSNACELLKKIKATLPGYLVPKLVREIKGEDNKREICF